VWRVLRRNRSLIVDLPSLGDPISRRSDMRCLPGQS
jgi:hypothetical protein